jgi:hypothetical protein
LFVRGIGTGNREQGTGNREQARGKRQEARGKRQIIYFLNTIANFPKYV